MNPYRQWLGLPNRPRDYYELLGLAPDEAEPEVVRAAAESALGRLRKVLATHADRPEVVRQVHQLAAQIKKAAASLGESRARSEHDASQRSETGEAPSAPVIQPTAPRRAYVRRSRRVWPVRAAYGLALLCFIVLLAVFVHMVNQYAAPDRQRLASSGQRTPQSAADLPLPELEPEVTRARAANAPDGNHDDDAARQQTPTTQPIPSAVTHRQVATAAQQAETDNQVEEVAAMIDAIGGGGVPSPPPEMDPALADEAVKARLRAAWLVLQAGDTPAAQRALASLSSLNLPEQWAGPVDRLHRLTDLVAEFWRAFDAGCREAVGSELTVDGRPMFLVEAEGDRFVIRDQGRTLRYARQELPVEIVLAIADRWLQPNAPSTPALRGAFLATGPAGADERVVREWRAARNAGAALEDLDAVLEDRRKLFAP